jgi:hypothetical protein
MVALYVAGIFNSPRKMVAISNLKLCPNKNNIKIRNKYECFPR